MPKPARVNSNNMSHYEDTPVTYKRCVHLPPLSLLQRGRCAVYSSGSLILMRAGAARRASSVYSERNSRTFPPLSIPQSREALQ